MEYKLRQRRTGKNVLEIEHNYISLLNCRRNDEYVDLFESYDYKMESWQ